VRPRDERGGEGRELRKEVMTGGEVGGGQVRLGRRDREVELFC
jgi:hypothetical protein